MHTVPEWVTVLLLALYYVPLYLIAGVGLKRRKEPKMAFWAPYLIFQTCLLGTAFATTRDIDIVFVGMSIGLLLGLPIFAVALVLLTREESKVEESS